MQARRRVKLYTLAFAFYVVATFVAALDARAHGDAAWIQEGGYVDANNVHCCCPADCHREMAAKFREAPEGIYVATGAGDEVLMPRKLVHHGLYSSIDDHWWICVRGGVVKCVFKPSKGT